MQQCLQNLVCSRDRGVLHPWSASWTGSSCSRALFCSCLQQQRLLLQCSSVTEVCGLQINSAQWKALERRDCWHWGALHRSACCTQAWPQRSWCRAVLVLYLYTSSHCAIYIRINSFRWECPCVFSILRHSHCIVDTKEIKAIRPCLINTLLSSKQPCDQVPVSTNITWPDRWAMTFQEWAIVNYVFMNVPQI